MARNNIGEDNTQAVLTAEDVRDMRQRYPDETQQELADDYGVSRRCVQQAVNGQTWGHL